MDKEKRNGWLCIFSGVFILCLLGLVSPSMVAAANDVMIIGVDGPISPGSATFLARGIKEAESVNASLVIVQLDTPGGLGSSMRTMVKAITNSKIPVVVYVSPTGAGAASAGVLITVSAHVAAMAPGTNIGAAHPVSIGGEDIQKTMSEKVVNDMASYGRGIAKEKGRNAEWVERAIRESVSITADEALENHVIDLVAKDMDDLLTQLDGWEVTLITGKVTLQTTNLTKIFYQPGFRDKLLNVISDPNIVWFLMVIGLAGLYFEFSHPGAIFPGVIGAISLILFFFSIQTLPVNYTGLLLIVLAIILFIAEIKITSYGILSIGGVVSFTLGSIMLFEDVGVPLKLMAPTIILISGFFIGVSTLAFRAYRSKPQSGMEGLIGEVGVVKERIDPEGKVFVHGELWRAASRERIEPNEKVEVEEIQGLLLKVRKAINSKF
ncbi:MAG: nodulation protein NfeD [Deltaproteobacteria bacterium]|nr:nodulation protein NfeD [Deltaproteobacteria bacterium]